MHTQICLRVDVTDCSHCSVFMSHTLHSSCTLLMISKRETPLSSTVSHSLYYNVCDCGFILGMSTDAFGILLGNVIYAAYIVALSNEESEICSDGRRLRQDHNGGTVSY